MDELPRDDSARLVHRTPAAIEQAPTHDPATYWRVGFSVPAIAAGYAYPRDGVIEDLVEHLAAGENVLLVGPRGCGKSTICKQVVARLLADDDADVYHLGAVDGATVGSHVDVADLGSTAETTNEESGTPTIVVVEDGLRQPPGLLEPVLDAAVEHPDVQVVVEARRGTLDQFGAQPSYVDEAMERCRRLLGGDAFRTVTVPSVETETVETITAFFDDLVDADVDHGQIPQAYGPDGSKPAVGDEWVQIAHALTADTGHADALDRSVHDAYEAVTDDGAASLRARLALAVNLCNAARIPCDDRVLYGLSDDPDAVDDAVASLAGTVLTSGADGRYLPPHEIWSSVYVRELVEREPIETARAAFATVVDHLLTVAADPDLDVDAPTDRSAGDSGAEPFGEESTDADRASSATDQDAVEGTGRRPLIADRSLSDVEDSRSLIMTAPAHTHRTSMTIASVLTRLGEFGKQWPVLAPLFETGPDRPLQVPDSCTPMTAAKFQTMCGEIHLERGDLETAAACFDDALERVRTAATSDVQLDKASVHYHLNKSKIEQKRGVHDSAVEHLETARETAADRGYRVGEARALLELGTVRSKQGDTEAAFDAHRESLEHFQSLGNHRMTAKVLKEMGNLQFRRGDYDRASEHYEEALAVYRRLGERNGEASCLSNLGVVATYQERFDAAREYQERSLGIREQIGAKALMASTLNNLGIVERRTGNLSAARAHYERSLEIKREMGDREGVASSLANLGIVHRELGNLDRAESYEQESLEIYEEMGAPRNQAKCQTDLARIYLKQGRLEAATETLERALATFERTDDRGGVGRSNHWLGEVAEERGDQEIALEQYQSAFDALADAGAFGAVEAATSGVRVARELGDEPTAQVLFESAREYVADHGFEAQFESHLESLDWEPPKSD